MRNFKIALIFKMALAASLPAFAADRTVMELSAGEGARSVGIIPSSEEVEASGPVALTVGDDGTIYVLDQNNNRVLSMDAARSGGTPDALALPADLPADDLAMVHDQLYLWSDGVVPLERKGAKGGEQTLRAADGGGTDDYARSVFASMGSVPPGPLNSIVEEIGRSQESRPSTAVTQFVPSRGLGDIVAEVSVTSPKDARVLLRRSNEEANFVSLAISAESEIGTVELLDVDATGRPFALVELVPSEDADRAGLLVARFTPDGTLDRAYDLPIEPRTVFSRRFVAIGPNGDVLFLKSEEARARVLSLEGREPGQKLTYQMSGNSSGKGGKGTKGRKGDKKIRVKGGNMAILPKSRSTVIERAIGFETQKWVVTPGAYGTYPGPSCPSMNRLRRPLYLIGKLNQTVTGVPYCWGCKTPLDDFLAGVAKGRVAGNVCTRSAPISSIIGVDCSGFVSEAWGLKSHVSTAAIPAIAKQLPDPWKLQPGDALNKPGSHVMLFMRFTGDRKVEVMESSPNACKGRVCRNTYSLSTLLMRGYRPVRYKGINS